MTVLHDIAKEAGFVPDVIAPECRVPLKQLQFPEHEVLFAANYFMYYVKRYKWAFSHGSIGRVYEHWLDFWFTGPLTPRRFLVLISDMTENTKKMLKRILINHLPNLDLSLRNRRLKKNTQNVV
jgi:hypothetical protein